MNPTSLMHNYKVQDKSNKFTLQSQRPMQVGRRSIWVTQMVMVNWLKWRLEQCEHEIKLQVAWAKETVQDEWSSQWPQSSSWTYHPPQRQRLSLIGWSSPLHLGNWMNDYRQHRREVLLMRSKWLTCLPRASNENKVTDLPTSTVGGKSSPITRERGWRWCRLVLSLDSEIGAVEWPEKVLQLDVEGWSRGRVQCSTKSQCVASALLLTVSGNVYRAALLSAQLIKRKQMPTESGDQHTQDFGDYSIRVIVGGL